MRPKGPAYGIEPHKIIRERRLQLRSVGPKLEGVEVQTIHVWVARLAIDAGRGRQVDADLRPGDRCPVVQPIADDIDPKPKFVHQRVAENLSLGYAAKVEL